MSAHERIEVPDVILEQYRLDELPREEADRVGQLAARERDASAPSGGARPNRTPTSPRQYPPAWMAERVRERLGREGARVPERRGQARRWGLPAAIGLAAIALVVVLPRLATMPAGPGPVTTTDSDRIKGLLPSLAVYRRTDRGTETLADGAVARKGDLLRLGYTAAGQSHGVILSIDGRGAVTLHLPSSGHRAAPLGRDGTVLLDQAYELDDAPGWERFYLRHGRSSLRRGADRRGGTPRGGRRFAIAARDAPDPARALPIHVLVAERGQTVKTKSTTSWTGRAPRVFLAIGLVALGARPAAADVPLQRFTLVIGANFGGAERPRLQYAVSDAERFARVLVELGGVTPANEIVLRQPKLRDLLDALDLLSARVTARRGGPAAAGPRCCCTTRGTQTSGACCLETTATRTGRCAIVSIRFPPTFASPSSTPVRRAPSRA